MVKRAIWLGLNSKLRELRALKKSARGAFRTNANEEGYQSETDSGLMLLGYRYYDPSVGRFLTRDPSKVGRSWHAYCGQRPTKSFDPSGLQADYPPNLGFAGPRQGKIFFDQFDWITVIEKEGKPVGRWGTPIGVDPTTNGLPPDLVGEPSIVYRPIDGPVFGWEGVAADFEPWMTVKGAGVGGGNQYYFDDPIPKNFEPLPGEPVPPWIPTEPAPVAPVVPVSSPVPPTEDPTLPGVFVPNPGSGDYGEYGTAGGE